MAACGQRCSHRPDLNRPAVSEINRAQALQREWDLRLDRLARHLNDCQAQREMLENKENDRDC